MKKLMIICLYTAFVGASDYNYAAKEIERLKRLARTANKNGYISIAESYLGKAVKLAQDQELKKQLEKQLEELQKKS